MLHNNLNKPPNIQCEGILLSIFFTISIGRFQIDCYICTGLAKVLNAC